jgi:uncharacterized protein YutE (UPF0331/DUF86 family)
VTYLVERLAELRRHLDHLRALRPQASPEALAANLSLHNDVLFSLIMVCQLVMNLAGELSARRGMPFEDYRQAVRNLSGMNLVTPGTVAALERLPGFRNVLVHEYVALDLARAVEAMDALEPVEELAEAVRRLLVR